MGTGGRVQSSADAAAKGTARELNARFDGIVGSIHCVSEAVSLKRIRAAMQHAASDGPVAFLGDPGRERAGVGSPGKVIIEQKITGADGNRHGGGRRGTDTISSP